MINRVNVVEKENTKPIWLLNLHCNIIQNCTK
jgi:hypothetical protein